MFEMWKFNRQLRHLRRLFAKEHEQLEKRKAAQSEYAVLDASEWFEVQEIEKEMDCFVVTCPSFCTRFNERVYITAIGCEFGFGTHGLQAAGAGGL